jgi:hypothetical protein
VTPPDAAVGQEKDEVLAWLAGPEDDIIERRSDDRNARDPVHRRPTMRATRDQLPLLFGTDAGGIRGADWGGLRAAVVAIPAGVDTGPLLKGLPGDRCPCPHWGYVLAGRMRVTYADGEEVLQAGDLFYRPPGHAVVAEQAVAYGEFSPPAAYDEFLEAARRNATVA